MKTVFERTEEVRAGYLQDAADLAKQLDDTTPLETLRAAEVELEKQLADVRRRMADREELERQHAHAAHMAALMAREIETARGMYAPPPADVLAQTGLPVQPPAPPVPADPVVATTGPTETMPDTTGTAMPAGAAPFRPAPEVAKGPARSAPRTAGPDDTSTVTTTTENGDDR